MYGSSYMFRHYIANCRESAECLLGAADLRVCHSYIHHILSTAPQLNISQKALGTLPEDGK
jgi:hypothetical protein